MRKIKLITTIVFCLFISLAFGQKKKFDCTKDMQEDQWLNKEYNFFKFLIEEEDITVDEQSYWFFGGGEGEASTSNSALIIPTKQKTVIYQYSPKSFIDKQIVKKKISVKYLSNYFKKLNRNVKSNIMANAKYFVLSVKNNREDKCIKVIYSVEFPPIKDNDKFLIDFSKIIK